MHAEEHAASTDPARVRARWQGGTAALRYAGAARWSSARRAARDPRLVSTALSRHGVDGALLDAPCGAGRLFGVLAARGPYCGVDASPAMLREARAAGAARLVLGDLERLPFDAGTFDVVVACRILHHLREPEHLARVVRELVRVSSRLVVASFWDHGSLSAWRRRGRARPGEPRRAFRKDRLRAVFAEAGADVIDWRHSLRFVSQQAFAVARKRAP